MADSLICAIFLNSQPVNHAAQPVPFVPFYAKSLFKGTGLKTVPFKNGSFSASRSAVP
jgi:hypothetical protein